MSLTLSIEVLAHARAITGCDICQNNEYLITVSEDSWAKIWQLTKEGNSYVMLMAVILNKIKLSYNGRLIALKFQKIKHAHNIQVKDSMLMGGRFLTSNGSKFCVTSYDSNIVTCYAL